MTTPSTILSDVESVVAAAIPGMGIATAAAEAVTGVTKIIAPIVSDSIAQKYEQQEQETLTRWQNLCSVRDFNPVQWSTFFVQLTTNAGHPCGSLAGGERQIPDSVLTSLVEIAAEYPKLRAQLNALQAK